MLTPIDLAGKHGHGALQASLTEEASRREEA